VLSVSWASDMTLDMLIKRHSLENPLSYIDSNLVGFGHILEGCRHNGVEHLVYASSSSVYNIGNNNPVELMDYIEALESSLGKTAEKELLPLQPGDVPDTYADVDDLVAEFGYKPSMSVKQGVANFAQWYKEYNNI